MSYDDDDDDDNDDDDGMSETSYFVEMVRSNNIIFKKSMRACSHLRMMIHQESREIFIPQSFIQRTLLTK